MSWARLRVFVVSLVALFILGTLLFLLTGGQLLQPKATLYLYVADVTGLAEGSPVRVDGIDVGKVASVELSGSNQPDRVVRITMSVLRSRLPSIPSDSYAELSTDNMVGDWFVDVTSGSAASSIRPGGELTYKTGGLMKSLDLRQFEQKLRQVDALLTDIEQGRSRVGQFVKGDDVYNTLKKRVAEIDNDIRDATGRNTPLGQAIYTDKLYREIRDPVARLDRRLAELQSGQGSLGQLLTDAAQHDHMRSAIQDFRQSVADLHASEFIRSDAAYAQWNKSLASLIRSVDDFNTNPLISTSQAYDNLNGFAREITNTLRDFRGDPRKFLRLKVF